ncbi:hypothetical protein F7D34_14500 [Prevotella copri]|uniref:Uncharacterized protein n=1 Tax=Segatella copri TaxID=165179 RepID=A0A646HKW1_9BACT|nr:hypothetical protein [Segatella copri]MQN89569.1 hypothetical protein [Segatella copri]MQO79131.1 hypothetical protein [Segatella copri]
MGEHINKLALSSKHYYSFIASIVKETQAYFENADEGYTICCANYLNEDRFDEDEKLVLSVFNSDDISNQTFIYGAVCLQPYQETELQLVSGLLITDERVLVRLYVTDDQEHDFEYYYYCEWNQLASVKKEKDEDGDDFIVLIDNENEEVGFLDAQLLGGRYDNMKISSLWIDFLNDAIRETNNPIKQEPVENNNIYTEFMSNKQLFKPFVSWPDCVHLGLNNVDAISNKLLNEITLRRDEYLLWVSRHKANWKAKDDDEKTPSGCIITDQRICYFNLNDKKKSFTVEWGEVAAIKHMMNSFYIQKSLAATSYDLKICDYALFDKKVENSSSVVAFLTGIAGNAFNGNYATKKEASSNVELSTKEKQVVKEQLISGMVEQLKQFPNKDERVVQNNEKPKENKVVRRSFL